ncbi:MAG: DUF924 family protein [Alphaproteobacteria bacterium]
MDAKIDEIIEFWFGPVPGEKRDIWLERSNEYDAELRTRFGDVHDRASPGECDHWTETPKGIMALIVLLDQFSRNLYRGDACAFATDAKALEIADVAIENGSDRKFTEAEQIFFYLPHEHSEDLEIQKRSVNMFSQTKEWGTEYADAHLRIIERFGRFPHRNAVLGRVNTPEEEEYLAQPREGFEAG